MTIEEAAKILGKSISTLESSFPRTKKNLEKQGIILNKIGYGKDKEYTIEYTENYINLIGQKFGRLTIIEKVDSVFTGGKKRGAFKCKCDCGNEIIALRENLLQGNTKSCGCLQAELYKNNQTDITNQKFGKLTALYPTEKRKWKCVVWHCKCDCGNECEVTSHELKNGNTQSCGCLNSKGEQKIISILQAHNIPFVKEKIFSSLPQLRFDFYIDNKYIIEFDGIQHFKTKNSYWDTEDHLQQTQRHDKIKSQYCKDNNIPLIRIPYWHIDQLCFEDLLLETSNFVIT